MKKEIKNIKSKTKETYNILKFTNNYFKLDNLIAFHIMIKWPSEKKKLLLRCSENKYICYMVLCFRSY